MEVVVGHTTTVSKVEEEKPRVSLFVGPSSVGKWTVAEYLRGVWRVDEADTMRVENLTAQAARDLVEFALYAGSSTRRLAIVRLDGAQPAAMNTLLKTLEEDITGTDFILIAEHPTLPTIVTRAVTYRFGFLTAENVTEVLVKSRHFKPDDAERYAEMSGGQVSRALSVVNNRDLMHVVRMAIKAFREMDPAALEVAAKEWTDEHSALLAQWCRETLTGRARIFSEEEFLPTRRIPLRALAVLNSNVRPRLMMRSGMMALVRGEE